MKLNGEEGTDQPLVNGCCQEVARTEESPGEEAGEEGAKNDKEIVLIQDMGFNVQIQIPGGNPIELPVRPQLSYYHKVLLCTVVVRGWNQLFLPLTRKQNFLLTVIIWIISEKTNFL